MDGRTTEAAGLTPSTPGIPSSLPYNNSKSSADRTLGECLVFLNPDGRRGGTSMDDGRTDGVSRSCPLTSECAAGHNELLDSSAGAFGLLSP